MKDRYQAGWIKVIPNSLK